jgi:phage terminase large subunit
VSLSVKVELPPKLIPVFAGPAMYRGAYGGRGSAKTRSFAKMAAVWGLRFAQANLPGVIVCAREFMNSLDESSFAEVKAAIFSEPWLAERYDVGEKYIRTRDRKIDFAFSGLRHNLDSIKSKSRIRLLWVDEADPVSETAWQKADNTVREEESETWITWNPERKNSATHKRFRLDPPTNSKIIELNWRDNPWFPATLNAKRLEDLTKRPEQYAHVWEGDFVSIVEGAYYAQALAEAKAQGRIGRVARDPLMQLRAFWDIGVRDATAIWIAQFVGREIRVLDYYEAIGQPLATHLNWLRSKGYASALCVLPHDGRQADKVTAIRFEDHISAAGFDTETIENQGKGAALKRVEVTRRLFPSIWFNADSTESGRDALGWYHEKRDDKRDVGIGVDHDWSSHCADAFGLMCVAYEAPPSRSQPKPKERQHGAHGWMA